MLRFVLAFTFLLSPATAELVNPPDEDQEHYELDEACQEGD